MNEFSEDLLNSEYLDYRIKYDLFQDFYKNALTSVAEVLGNPHYKFKYIHNVEGDLYWYWRGPFEKATHLQKVEMYLETDCFENAIGLLKNYIFKNALSFEDVIAKTPEIALYQSIIYKNYQDRKDYSIINSEADCYKKIEIFPEKVGDDRFSSVQITAYFKFPEGYNVNLIDFDSKFKAQIKNESTGEFNTIPDKEFYERQIKLFNSEYETKLADAIKNFGQKYGTEIKGVHKINRWINAFLHKSICIYDLEISESDSAIGYIESWILKVPIRLDDLKNILPIIQTKPDRVTRAPQGNKVYIYDAPETTKASIWHFGFTRDIFSKINIITYSKYYYLPKHYTKTAQN